MSALQSYWGVESHRGFHPNDPDDTHWGSDRSDVEGGRITLGTPVPALAAGIVAMSGWDPGHGWFVSIDTLDGWYDTYSHMLEQILREGDRVGPAETVGRTGSTGQSTGPHMHGQRTKVPQPWKHGTEIDPEPRIAAIVAASLISQEDDMPRLIERGVNTGVFSVFPTDEGITKLPVGFVDSIPNGRAVIEQAFGSPIAQMFETDYDAFVKAFKPILASSVGGGGNADTKKILDAVAATPAKTVELMPKKITGTIG